MVLLWLELEQPHVQVMSKQPEPKSLDGWSNWFTIPAFLRDNENLISHIKFPSDTGITNRLYLKPLGSDVNTFNFCIRKEE